MLVAFGLAVTLSHYLATRGSRPKEPIEYFQASTTSQPTPSPGDDHPERKFPLPRTAITQSEIPLEPSPDLIDGGIQHSLDPAGLRQALWSAMPEIEHCYLAWLRIQPNLGGRFNVRLTIDTLDRREGQVTGVSLSDAGVGNLAFEGCILSVVAALRFAPPLHGKIELSHPLAFVAPPQPTAQLQLELETLCPRIRYEALRLEHSKVSPDDLLTVVLQSLAAQSPGLGPYIATLLPGDVPPVQRRETFKRAISAALSRPWVCPEFDALWDGQSLSEK